MRDCLVCGLAVVALTGCFEDPPSSGTGGDASTTSSDAGSSTVDPTVDTSEASTSVGSSGNVDSSTSGGTSCIEEPFTPPAVPADIVVLIDEGFGDMAAGLVQDVVDEFQSVGGNNVAVLAPEGLLATLDIPSDCANGCASCDGMTNRVTVPYTGTAYEALSGLQDYLCIFREPAPSTSGPTAHLWFVTQAPEQMPPMDLADVVLMGDVPLRVHLACPGCDDNLFNANALLAEVVQISGGTVTDTMMPVTVRAQAAGIGLPRHSCAWETDATPEYYAFQPPMGDGVQIDPVGDFANCSEEDVDNGLGAFHETDFGYALCPETCKTMQAFPDMVLDVLECSRG